MTTRAPVSSMALRDPEPDVPSWTFFTNHAHVLIAINRDVELRQRDIAHAVGITTGAVQRIIRDLEHAGYVHRERIGRRNRYVVTADLPLRHPLERPHSFRELLDTLDG